MKYKGRSHMGRKNKEYRKHCIKSHLIYYFCSSVIVTSISRIKCVLARIVLEDGSCTMIFIGYSYEMWEKFVCTKTCRINNETYESSPTEIKCF